jgi:hypothetical protein
MSRLKQTRRFPRVCYNTAACRRVNQPEDGKSRRREPRVCLPRLLETWHRPGRILAVHRSWTPRRNRGKRAHERHNAGPSAGLQLAANQACECARPARGPNSQAMRWRGQLRTQGFDKWPSASSADPAPGLQNSHRVVGRPRRLSRRRHIESKARRRRTHPGNMRGLEQAVRTLARARARRNDKGVWRAASSVYGAFRGMEKIHFARDMQRSVVDLGKADRRLGYIRFRCVPSAAMPGRAPARNGKRSCCDLGIPGASRARRARGKKGLGPARLAPRLISSD